MYGTEEQDRHQCQRHGSVVPHRSLVRVPYERRYTAPARVYSVLGRTVYAKYSDWARWFWKGAVHIVIRPTVMLGPDDVFLMTVPAAPDPR